VLPFRARHVRECGRIARAVRFATVFALATAAPPAAAILGDASPGTASPGGHFCPAPDGRRDAGDGLVTLRRSLGLVAHWDCGFSDRIIDVAPCHFQPDGGGGPPTCVPMPDGRVTAADALIVTRVAVGVLRLQAPNPRYVIDIAPIPVPPALGDLDATPGSPPFPGGTGDVDCDGDGVFDGPEDAFLQVLVTTDNPPRTPYDVCLWIQEDVARFDFDAPPFGNFPGPEDHDGLLTGGPPAPDACVTLCPEDFADPSVDCATTLEGGGQARLVDIGPVVPMNPLGTQLWSVVVDPDFALDDDEFTDNITRLPVAVQVKQCAPTSPDLVPRPFIDVSPTDPTQQDDITFTIQVENQGEDAVVVPFDVDLYLDFQPIFGPPQPGCNRPRPPGDAFRTVHAGEACPPDGSQCPLLPGEVTPRFSFSTTPPPDNQPLNLDPGLHTAMVLVDSVDIPDPSCFGLGNVKERNETNNLFPARVGGSGGRFCVGTGKGFGSPDLAIAEVHFLAPEVSERQEICDRRAGSRVDIEVTLANLDDLANARDLGISRPRQPRLYTLSVGAERESSLDGLLIDCFPVGFESPRLRGSYNRFLDDSLLSVSILPSETSVPQDVDTSNNFASVPLLNKPAFVDAGPDEVTLANIPVQLGGSASDPNDIPVNPQPPLVLEWIVVTAPPGSNPRLDDPGIASPVFTPDKPGAYTIELRATDCAGAGLTGSDSLVVTAPAIVPSVVGQPQASAEAALVAASLSVGTVSFVNSFTVPEGRVISQSPVAGSVVDAGSGVDLVVSLGPPMVTVPDVVGQPRASAESALVAASLSVGTVTFELHFTVPEGSVISQSPLAGSVVIEGSPVALVVSLGPPMVTVPDVVGQPQASAESALVAASLSVGTVTEENSFTVPVGSVISQSPAAGSVVIEGSPVALVVSLGP
jgi:hypothetical protein